MVRVVESDHRARQVERVARPQNRAAAHRQLARQVHVAIQQRSVVRLRHRAEIHCYGALTYGYRSRRACDCVIAAVRSTERQTAGVRDILCCYIFTCQRRGTGQSYRSRIRSLKIRDRQDAVISDGRAIIGTSPGQRYDTLVDRAGRVAVVAQEVVVAAAAIPIVDGHAGNCHGLVSSSRVFIRERKRSACKRIAGEHCIAP